MSKNELARRVGAALAATAVTATACGGTHGNDRPAAPRAPAPLDVSGIDAGAEHAATDPTRGAIAVIDWPPEVIAEIERSMLESVAVLHYDGCSLRVLEDCTLEGSYGFVGLPRQDSAVQLTTGAEIRAALACSGPALASKLEGDLQRGASLDITMAVVGERKTTPTSAKRADLRGDCGDATHFVRRASVGAVTMRTGTRGQPGGSGSSTSSHALSRQEGTLEECARATPDAKKPPVQCGAILSLDVQTIE